MSRGTRQNPLPQFHQRPEIIPSVGHLGQPRTPDDGLTLPAMTATEGLIKAPRRMVLLQHPQDQRV